MGRSWEVAAEDEPPIDVSVFYSREDIHWSSAEKTIDEVAKRIPRLNILKRSIDDAEGYERLAEIEKTLKVIKPGELTLVMGAFVLTSKGERRDVEKYFATAMERFLHAQEKKGRMEVNLEQYASEIFGENARVEAKAELPPPHETQESDGSHIQYRRVMQAGKALGWVMNAHVHIHCPVCNDVQFLMAVSVPELNILDVRPVKDLERFGAKLDSDEASAFVGQFKGWSVSKANQKVDAISSATKTSLAYEKGIKEILSELKMRN